MHPFDKLNLILISLTFRTWVCLFGITQVKEWWWWQEPAMIQSRNTGNNKSLLILDEENLYNTGWFINMAEQFMIHYWSSRSDNTKLDFYRHWSGAWKMLDAYNWGIVIWQVRIYLHSTVFEHAVMLLKYNACQVVWSLRGLSILNVLNEVHLLWKHKAASVLENG